jgi:hypothetical protein
MSMTDRVNANEWPDRRDTEQFRRQFPPVRLDRDVHFVDEETSSPRPGRPTASSGATSAVSYRHTYPGSAAHSM